MSLYNGRPVEENGRQKKEIKVYSLLDELNISYQRADHEEANTMEACNAIDKILGITMCKNLFLCNRPKTEFYLLMMPSNKPFKTKDITKQIGCSRLSFADSEYLEKYLNIKPGAVSVMGLMNDTENKVQLLIDKPVCESEFIGCHPCVSTSSLKIRTQDILEKYLPAVSHSPIIVDLPDYNKEYIGHNSSKKRGIHMKITFNTDEDVVKTIKEGLKRTGGYCPCKLERSEDNKCMCKEFKEQIKDPNYEGYCHCMLYYKSNDENEKEN